MTDAKPAGLPSKESTRPAYGGWAPGNYMCQCVGCRSIFIGDKRALHCADCAYALPDTKAALDTERAARLAAEARVRKLEDALRAVDAELANGFTVCDRCANEEGLSDLDCRETIRAALKEPANG